jgi:hypothetical protein
LDQEVATGYPDDSFRPTLSITRAQAVSQLYGLLGRPGFEGDIPPMPFTDVPMWVAGPVIWLHDHEVIDGYPDDTFRPNQPITRGQVARLLYRIAGSPDVSGLDPHGLSDVPAWVADAVTWLVDGGVLTGYPDQTFRPNAGITRAETIRMLFRMDCASPWTGPTALDQP